ncbi:MAG: bifunctional diaminohydroxyphosphoribosylaminopyrimidine deaminase/5-amino-6-(5-phosphoribosylamino)uracil reductase RibD [Selenomonadaceae bacterium]|nr:bifunctional diaminohydroxyphosphoribosylaminopyrimidine deaminase/5-amino-6-(5-phosphoribosylamino)uracil reductase RibD [Selenomonadaceae bacterium]
MHDEKYMQLALQYAAFARGRTSPNPLVGAVIVKDGRIVGTGWHRKAGTPHAEIHALNMAGELAKGATIYVTLEPCAHHGRTGPCAEALVKAGISRAVVATLDPNPKVSGKGIDILRKAGIDVTVGVCEKEAKQLMEVFLKWIVTGRPFTVWKTAMSLDGKIATSGGESQWITGDEARAFGHRLRDEYDAIMAGIGTVLADNPSLTTRLNEGVQKPLSDGRWVAAALADKNISPAGRCPVRIIVDSLARTPLDSKVLTDGKAPTIIAVAPAAPAERIAALRQAGAEVLMVPADPSVSEEEAASKVNLTRLMEMLGDKGRGITSVLVEGGGTLAFSLLKAGLMDKVHAFVAPMLIGGQEAKAALGGEGFSHLADAPRLKDVTTDLVGSDIHITGYI